MKGSTGGMDGKPELNGTTGLSALECLRFHPCDSVADYRHRTHAFNPLYAHHFFPEEEICDGWLSCQVHIFFTHDTFDAYVVIDGVPAATNPLSAKEDLMKQLETIPFPGGFCKTEEDFLEALTPKVRSDFVLPGRSLRRDTKLPNGEETCVDIRLCHFDLSQPDPVEVSDETAAKAGSKSPSRDEKAGSFSLLHRRVEWLMHFFIESCSTIDRDDRWAVLLPFIHKQIPLSAPSGPQRSKTTGSVAAFSLAGMATVYNFFSIPKCRMRISQFFVLPHLQQKGLGQVLMESIYSEAERDEEVMEVGTGGGETKL
eukprot:GHVN01066044.1.p1 GENE.GHVN01066044.1~~GHVN01066044.1.p1  ORF type:complete len:314 (+),score=45.32 GHVN01066044.1:41-982(+)